jgi:hypothetical protein
VQALADVGHRWDDVIRRRSDVKAVWFDGLFCVDLPNEAEREAIWAI